VREALTMEAFVAINETFHALEGHARRGLTIRRRCATR